MSASRRLPVLTFLGGLLVFAAALATRHVYLQEYGFTDAAPGAVWQVQGRGLPVAEGQATELERLVHNLKTTGVPDGFRAPNPLGPKTDEPIIDRAPLYPLLRVGVESLVEQYQENFPVPPHGAVRYVQVLLGSLTCVLYFAVTLRAFGNNYLLALIVGLTTAFYPFWIMNTAELEDGTLTSFLLAWSLALGVKAGQQGGVIRCYLFGLVLAALALTRAALLPFAVVAQLWFFLRCRRVNLGGLCALLTLLGFATGMTPWVLWNVQAHGEPVPVVGTAWFHLWVGNNPAADGNAYQWSMPLRLPQEVRDQLEQTAPARRYELLAPYVAAEVEERPLEAVRRRVRAFSQFFFGMNRTQSPLFYTGQAEEGKTQPEVPPWVRVGLYASLIGTLALAVLGWRWSYGWRYHAVILALAVYWIPVPYLLGHAGPFHSARLPLDGVLITLAGVGLLGLIPGLGRRLLAGEDRPQAT